MSDDKFLACLLSENDCSKNGLTQNSVTSLAKQSNSCDKNGNFDESNEEYVIDKETKRLSVSSIESSTENHDDDECKKQPEEEVASTKEKIINNEVDDTFKSAEVAINLELINSKDTVMHTVETSAETTTVVSEHQQDIEMKPTDNIPSQQTHNNLDCLQVQQLLDSVLCTIETPHAKTTAVVPEQQHQEIEMKPTDSIPIQLSQDVFNGLPAQQLMKNAEVKYREDADSSDDDTSSTFSLGSSSDCSDSFLDKMHRSYSPGNKIPKIRTKGELDLDELPPIEDLTINITEREMQKVGTIFAVVDKLVIVRALKDLQPLDLDSVLFLSCKETLGRIFDVFGPVVEPFYSVRFNSTEHIAKKTIDIDSDVFFAPEKTDITSYVFVDQLRKQKGSDASWQDNNEPPEEYLDYSDDEQEKAAKRKRAAKSRNHHQDSDDVQVIPSKVSRDTTPKNSDEINPWIDIQKYQLSLNNKSQQALPNFSPKNPFRQPCLSSQGYTSITPAKPHVAPSSERYANRGQERYGAMTSQGGANMSVPFSPQHNVTAPLQHQYLSQPTALQRGPIAVSSTYFSPQPQFAIQPRPSSLYPQSPMSPVPSLQRPMNFMQQPQRPPHPGMASNHIFGQPPYFNNNMPSPMGIPPPPVASPAAFAYRPDARNFMNQPANFSGQTSHFNRAMSQPANFVSQPVNFVSQPANFVSQPATFNQNPLLAQPGRLQWQNGPASPYGMTPLSISIPNAPPSNAIYTPVPSPYNMWGSKSLNFPQSGYFGNNMQ